MVIKTTLSDLQMDPEGENLEEFPYEYEQGNKPGPSTKPTVKDPRISIFGEPLSPVKSLPHLQERILVYNFLQRPNGIIAICYHSFVAALIIISLMFFACTTVPHLEWWSMIALRISDYAILVIMVVELLVLCWASPCIGKYQGFNGAIRFITSPFRVLDLLVIVISGLICWLHSADQNYLIWLRCGQVVQVLRLENRFKPWRMLSSVIFVQRQPMLITAYMCFVVLVVMSTVVYYCERDTPDTGFTNIPNAIYWGIITVCSTGYGDIYPTTTAGRIICGIFAMIGMILYTIPPGIIATGLALKIQESNRQKHLVQKRVPAAILIQCAWRCYAASVNSNSEVTWKPYLEQNQFCEYETSGTDNVVEFIGFRLTSGQTQLTTTQKHCIRFLRAIKFAVARKQLRNAFKPYDIKDVMQQYSDGHSDVVSRVRHMQNRMYTLEESMDQLMQRLVVMQTVQSRKLDSMEVSFQRLQRMVNSTLVYQTATQKQYRSSSVSKL